MIIKELSLRQGCFEDKNMSSAEAKRADGSSQSLGRKQSIKRTGSTCSTEITGNKTPHNKNNVFFLNNYNLIFYKYPESASPERQGPT